MAKTDTTPIEQLAASRLLTARLHLALNALLCQPQDEAVIVKAREALAHAEHDSLALLESVRALTDYCLGNTGIMGIHAKRVDDALGK